MNLTKSPTPEEYEKEVSRINMVWEKAREDLRYHEGQNASNQRSTCPGFDYGECPKWKARSQEILNTVQKPKYEAIMSQAKQDLEDYQNQVISIRDLENKRKIEEHLAEQAQIIEDRITETFRVQSEAFMKLQQASTVTSDQTFVQTVNTSTDKGFVEQETLQSPQGLQGSFFPIMMLGVMLG